MTKAVVLLSGGQDSTTCFYWALERFQVEAAISFDYEQRHRVELELAEATARFRGVEHVTLHIEALAQLAGATLTNSQLENTPGGAPAAEGWHARHQLPPSFVPGRNLLFFSLAAAYAVPRDVPVIVTGVCQTDRAGYPDCRGEFVADIEEAICSGMDEPDFRIVAPLLNRTKAETWALADELGVLSQIILETHTCYEGDRSGPPKHWGYGCGVCGACVERMNGYQEFRLAQAEIASAR